MLGLANEYFRRQRVKRQSELSVEYDYRLANGICMGCVHQRLTRCNEPPNKLYCLTLEKWVYYWETCDAHKEDGEGG